MKKILFMLLFLMFVPILAAGCSTNSPQQDIPPAEQSEEQPEYQETYTVSITMNDSTRGNVSVDNLKAEYESGDIINLSVAPNHGYYLRGYSDTNEISYNREIVVSGNLNIVVNLEEGESCNFYGYKIARNCDKNINGMGHAHGNIEDFLKYKTFCNIASGSLALYCFDTNNFGAFVLKNSSNRRIITSYNAGTKTITQAQMQESFGDPTEEWIDVVEYDTNVGRAYYVEGVDDDSKPADCFESNKIFNIENFGENMFYLYKQGDSLAYNVTHNEDNNYSRNITRSNGKTIFIQSFKLFTIDNDIYYFTLSNVRHMMSKNEDYAPTFKINGEDYIVTFHYV